MSKHVININNNTYRYRTLIFVLLPIVMLSILIFIQFIMNYPIPILGYKNYFKDDNLGYVIKEYTWIGTTKKQTIYGDDWLSVKDKTKYIGEVLSAQFMWVCGLLGLLITKFSKLKFNSKELKLYKILWFTVILVGLLFHLITSLK
ncbi:hypothetical protein [Bacillus pseudomycoides]|uniref:Uncharacterized protein n=1 Tax=Bacillus pseudomycoides TaxID=64104 RepID=A0A2A8BTZ0_9BACI|nr:hypothetical protein [Bacillus pseudomycoides]PEA82953.1 hypothetical protein CON99_14325 [Bacillus pseudomycoides]PED69500.1 hypothetical protein CON97_24875 [Bacillus pseudomycoides]PEI34041.1 hypothetical protein CN620_26790 [Bacillus pseudomycoides]PEJ72539.1 hypothetical protein CN680_21690 [Bacillus pseudomycoides]PEM10712.1 hypothetical protein CN628_22340 [Bacillus pseudomycoides]